jgi:hypothetical protein
MAVITGTLVPNGLTQAIEWESARALQLQNALEQQRSDLARLQQMQNVYNGMQSGLGTAMSISALGAMNYVATTTQSFNRAHACHTACGCSGESAAPQVVYKTWNNPKPKQVEAERDREANRPIVTSPPIKLSLKTSPLFGYMRWRFDSPFAPLWKWFVRWALSTRRRMA